MYDVKKWAHSDKLTVKQLIEYLQANCKEDTVVTVCGAPTVYLNVDDNLEYVTLDNENFDCDEYDGHKPQQLRTLNSFS